jgi:YVTN family beta-propeller protein
MPPYAYIANSGDDTVSVIDTALSPPRVVETVNVGGSPTGVAVSPDKQRVYVTVAPSSLAVIRGIDNVLVEKVTVGGGPYGVAVTPDGGRVYVANYLDNTLSRVDTATYSVDTIEGEEGVFLNSPYGVAIGTFMGRPRVYVTSYQGSCSVTPETFPTNCLLVVESGGLGLAYPLFGPPPPRPLFLFPAGVAAAPDGFVYVANQIPDWFVGHDNFPCVTAMHEGEFIPAVLIKTGGIPFGVAIAPDGKRAYVSSRPQELGGIVNIIDTTTRSVVKNLSFPGFNGPAGVSVTPDGKHLYVTNQFGNTVTVVSLPDFTEVANVPVGKSPYSLGQFI